MSLDIASQVGESLGDLYNTQESLKTNINPDEPIPQLSITEEESFGFNGEIVVNKLSYATDSFIIDHPVYGNINSAILKINGGYATASSGSAIFPLYFPISFTTASTVLFTTTF